MARAHSEAEVAYLERHGADRVIMGEREIAEGMLDYAATETGEPTTGGEAVPEDAETGDASTGIEAVPRDDGQDSRSA